MAAAQGGQALNLSRTRIVIVSASLALLFLVAGLVLAGRSFGDGLLRALGNLAEVIHLVNTQYVDPVDLDALGEGLDAGLVESVDPWAAVLGEDELGPYREVLESRPAFGLVLTLRLGSAAVRQALPGSPAAEAELKLGDVIEEIDGIPTRGFPLWRVRLTLAAHVRDGTPARLKVVGRDMEERRELTLTPGDWTLESLETEVREGVTVVRLHALDSGVAERLREAVGDGPVVLDLRELAWGFEEEAVAAAGLFVRSGVVAQWKGRRAGEKSFETRRRGEPLPVPVVLVGSSTEGPGEILAAGLRRAGAVLVGGRTLGHAPHMTLVRDGDLVLWIPTARWVRADGKPITREEGITPDEVVERQGPVAEGEDPELERAIELALSGTEHAAAA